MVVWWDYRYARNEDWFFLTNACEYYCFNPFVRNNLIWGLVPLLSFGGFRFWSSIIVALTLSQRLCGGILGELGVLRNSSDSGIVNSVLHAYHRINRSEINNTTEMYCAISVVSFSNNASFMEDTVSYLGVRIALSQVTYLLHKLSNPGCILSLKLLKTYFFHIV